MSKRYIRTLAVSPDVDDIDIASVNWESTKLELSDIRSLSMKHHYALLGIGISLMVVAGFFLVEGLSQFAANENLKMALMASGILFQVAESACFITAAALDTKYAKWRGILLTGGVLLFMFSIAVVTIAQKASFEAGESSAQVADAKAADLATQIENLDKAIATYRLNAEKQSKSIYAQSRALGQDSLNKSMELADKRAQLAKELFALRNQRQVTSLDIFRRIENITGFGAENIELLYIFVRSLFLEFFGVLFLSIAAYFKPKTEVLPENKASDGATQTPHKRSHVLSGGVISIYKNRKIKSAKTARQYTEQDIQIMTEKILLLIEQRKLKRKETHAIQQALSEHYNLDVGTAVASKVAKAVSSLSSGSIAHRLL